MSLSVDLLSGAREVAPGVFVFTSGAYALNSGAVLASGGGASNTGISAERSSARKSPSGEASAARSASRPSLLIDPGYFPADIERIAAFLTASDASASRILLTHSDWDHVAGAVRWPDATVVASSDYPRRVASEGVRIESSLRQFDERLYVRREPPFSIPEPATLVGSPSDLVWPGPSAHLFPAGGHTSDGLMVLLRDARVLFAGDHLSDREVPFVGDSVDAYHETLVRVRRVVLGGEVDTLVPGHGDVCGREGILERIDEDADYLERLDAWVRETLRTIDTLEGLLERCDEVVFRKGWGNPDVHSEHRSNVSRLARRLEIA